MANVKGKICAVLCAGKVENYTWLKNQINCCDFLICADAGYLHAEKCAISPDLIIGDFDSAEKPDSANVISFPIRKDETDAFLAVEHAHNLGFNNIRLFGATGGRLDHTIANLTLCASFLKKGVSVEIIDELNNVFVSAPGGYQIKPDGYAKLSFFAFGSDVTGLTTKGVSYPLSGYTLKTDDSLAVCNEITSDFAEIEFDSGQLLILRCNDAF